VLSGRHEEVIQGLLVLLAQGPSKARESGLFFMKDLRDGGNGSTHKVHLPECELGAGVFLFEFQDPVRALRQAFQERRIGLGTGADQDRGMAGQAAEVMVGSVQQPQPFSVREVFVPERGQYVQHQGGQRAFRRVIQEGDQLVTGESPGDMDLFEVCAGRRPLKAQGPAQGEGIETVSPIQDPGCA
jgi:hypothetical protein